MRIALLMIALMMGQGRVTTEGIDPRQITPMDVPAIQEEQDVLTGTDTCKAAPECVGKDWSCNVMICSHDTEKVTKTTCADKTRILLTAEDGTRHCIKF